MSYKEFAVLLLVFIIWGLHFPVMRITVQNSAEPFFYAATRMSLVALILLPKLKWHAGQMRNILIAGLGFGGLNYAFGFPAMQYATASAAAITIELYIPISILLSVIFLGEHIGRWRIFGIVLAFAGVTLIALTGPQEQAGPYFLIGIAMMVMAAASEAMGAIFVKLIKNVGPLQLLAWFAVVGSCLLWPLSLTFETNQLDAFKGDNRAPFLWALAYSVLMVSIVAHASYYWLLQRLPMSLVAGCGFITPLVAVTAGVIWLGEDLSPMLALGGSLTLIGVTLIIWRNSKATAAKSP